MTWDQEVLKQALRERDDWKAKCIEARRVARVLADSQEPAFDCENADCGSDWCNAMRTALAYPEQDSTKET